MGVHIAHSLDLRGTPPADLAARVHAAIHESEPGMLVEIIASDRVALTIRTVSDAMGVDVLEASQFGTVVRFVFRKRAPQTDQVLRG
jgi:TusA-related sulfurtransferase